jgi:hypothetical protein
MMKHPVLKGLAWVLTVTLLAPAVASADPTFSLSFLGGVNIGKLTGDTDGLGDINDPGFTATGNINESKIGFAAGAMVIAQFTDIFGLQSGFLFTRKGGEGDLSGTTIAAVPVDFRGSAKVKLDYVELPLLATVSILTGDRITIKGMAGPALAFNTSAEAEIELTIAGLTGGGTEDIKEEVKDTDFGGVIGAGIAFATESVDILLDLRWTIGFTNVADVAGTNFDIKNNAFSVMAGIGVPLGR